jgi:hypothetical protein
LTYAKRQHDTRLAHQSATFYPNTERITMLHTHIDGNYDFDTVIAAPDGIPALSIAAMIRPDRRGCVEERI